MKTLEWVLAIVIIIISIFAVWQIFFTKQTPKPTTDEDYYNQLETESNTNPEPFGGVGNPVTW